ncbi:GNAT family N-acetyltransferase [Leucobacter allii]|uniref:GNAT family N-acetyltransferase n=2 Tax=Leucobacter allii TaxID=2932247 RepID=A0ABY4FHQ6_9MICO|nr:GNAT family N-acetyltransferase [Leucobacter allii]UOQ56212.1 GNAT family N-acetyltransferase [Leucobacter allii]
MDDETRGDSRERAPGARTALPADTEEMARILTAAFHDDPVWGPVFPEGPRRTAAAHAYWRFVVSEAVRFPESLVLEGPGGALEAVSVWLPPGADELSDGAHAAYEALIAELLGAEAAAALLDAGERFAAARPAAPHAYLTLLGTAPEARGRGAGMRLLAAGLDRADARGVPSYLESSNPANDARYERVGYRPHAIVTLADGTAAQCYWRDPLAR